MLSAMKNNEKKILNLLASVLLAAATFALFRLILPVGELFVRDYQMREIVLGGYGEADYHIIYSNVILGYLFKGLYSLCRSIAWWELVQLGLVFISLVLITYILLCYTDSKLRWMFSVLINFIFGMRLFHSIRYENTALVLAVAGILLARVSSMDEKKSHRIMGFIAGAVFTVLSGLYSFETCLICYAFYLVYIVIDAIRIWREQQTLAGRLKKGIVHLLRFIFPLGIVYLLFVFSNGAYERNQEWKEWKEYYDTYEALSRKGLPELSEYAAEYEALGWSETDWQLFTGGLFEDDGVFGTEQLKALAGLEEQPGFQWQEIPLGAFFGGFTDHTFGVTALVLFACIFWLLRKKDIPMIVYTFALSVVLFCIYYLCRGFGSIPSMDYVLYGGCTMNFMLYICRKAPEEKLRVDTMQAVAACIACIVLGMHIYMETYNPSILWHKEQYIRDLAEYMEQDTEHIYFIDGNQMENTLAAYNIRLPENVRLLGGGLKNLPISYIENNGTRYDSWLSALIECPNAYLVTDNEIMTFVYYNYFCAHNGDNVGAYCDTQFKDYRFIRYYYNDAEK